MSRRATIIVIIIIAILIILGVVFALPTRKTPNGERTSFFGQFFGGGTTLPENTNKGEEAKDEGNTTPPEKNQEGQMLTLLSGDPVAAAAIGKEHGDVLFYRRDIGHLYGVGFNGENLKRISNITVPAVLDAEWSEDSNRSLIAFFEKNDAVKYFSSRRAGTSTEGVMLPDGVYGAVISPNGKRLAFLEPKRDTASVVLASPDGDKRNTIYSSKLFGVELSWITDSTLALKSLSSARAPGMLWSLSLDGTLSQILPPTNGLDALFAPDGKLFLYSKTSSGGKNLSLFLGARKGAAPTELSFTTLPEKCVWSRKEKNTIFCGVPRELPNAALPDAWWKGEVEFNDNIWKMNLDSGTTSLLWEANDFDVHKLFLSPEEDYLFFINKKDSTLWSLKLGGEN